MKLKIKITGSIFDKIDGSENNLFSATDFKTRDVILNNNNSIRLLIKKFFGGGKHTHITK